MVAIDSDRSLSPYSADMPMQPSPIGKTAGPVAPRVVVVVVVGRMVSFVVMQRE